MKKLSLSAKLKHCVGCRNNWYNSSDSTSPTGKCWGLETMQLVKKKAVPIDMRPPWNMPHVTVPNCYGKKGYVYINPEITC